jgi:N-acetylmuramoyl-L-alanine amidase
MLTSTGFETMKKNKPSVKILILSKKLAIMLLSAMILMLSLSAALVVRYAYTGKDGLDGKTIVIDPGHGGVDGGTGFGEILEKDINLDVSLRLRDLLEKSGAKVIMTRVEDVELGKSERIDRSRYMRDLNFRVDTINNSSADIFISIHTNSNINNPSTRGAIAFYYNSNPKNREIAYIFQNVFNTLEFDFQGNKYKSHHIPQKGNYYILRNSKIPGIIIETGFLTNRVDRLLLQRDDYKTYLSYVLYRGVVDYFASSDKPHMEIEDRVEIKEENLIKMHEDT